MKHGDNHIFFEIKDRFHNEIFYRSSNFKTVMDFLEIFEDLKDQLIIDVYERENEKIIFLFRLYPSFDEIIYANEIFNQVSSERDLK